VPLEAGRVFFRTVFQTTARCRSRTQTMARLKLDPIRARNLSNDYAKWLLQEQRERTPANGKLFARRHTTGGRRFHGFTEEQICTLIGGDYHDGSR
jgi:hypothetical protein